MNNFLYGNSLDNISRWSQRVQFLQPWIISSVCVACRGPGSTSQRFRVFPFPGQFACQLDTLYSGDSISQSPNISIHWINTNHLNLLIKGFGRNSEKKKEKTYSLLLTQNILVWERRGEGKGGWKLEITFFFSFERKYSCKKAQYLYCDKYLCPYAGSV